MTALSWSDGVLLVSSDGKGVRVSGTCLWSGRSFRISAHDGDRLSCGDIRIRLSDCNGLLSMPTT